MRRFTIDDRLPADPARIERRAFLGAIALVTSAAFTLPFVPTRASATSRHRVQDPRSRFLSVDGVRLHLLEWGDAGAPPMVLLHPAPLNAHAWDVFARAMAPRFHVIAPDARGFGESDWSASEKYNTNVFVQDLHSLVQGLGIGRFILCGNSLGGTVAMAYASTHPEMVERLIVVDTALGPKPSDPSQTPNPAQSGPASASAAQPPRRPPAPPLPLPPAGPFSSREEAVELTSKALSPAFVAAGAPWPDVARTFVHENLKQDAAGKWHWRYDRDGTAPAAVRALAETSRWQYWRSVTCPTLLLRGARSPALPQAHAEEMLRENPNARLVVIPDAGHFIALEQPAAFQRAIDGWLGQ